MAANQPGEIFLIESGSLRPLPGINLRDSPALRQILGGPQRLEAAMRDLLAQYPQLIPANQMGPETDPPRFVAMGREVSVPSGSVDLVFADHRGVPTLIETKLAENPDARRAVIGQILEYAAYAHEAWGDGQLRTVARDFWAGRTDTFEAALNAIRIEDTEGFWHLVEDNLKEGRLRLIAVADELRADARRTLEYLNDEFSRATIYGLELRCFEDSPGRLIVVPHLVGQSQATQDVKEASDVRWTLEKLRVEYAHLTADEQELGRQLARVLDWAVSKGLFMETYALARRPAFRLKNPGGQMVVSFYRDGAIHCQLGKATDQLFPGGGPQRAAYIQDLKRLELLEVGYGPDQGEWGKNLTRRLGQFNEAPLAALLELFERYFLRKGSPQSA